MSFPWAIISIVFSFIIDVDYLGLLDVIGLMTGISAEIVC